MAKRYTPLLVRLEAHHYKKITKESKQKKVSRAAFIRTLIENYVQG